MTESNKPIEPPLACCPNILSLDFVMATVSQLCINLYVYAKKFKEVSGNRVDPISACNK